VKESARVRTIAGKYELEKLLGQGGMGEVWVAKELSSGRKLALKLLKSAAADSKENRARFEREAHIATTLVSPHIAQVTDSGVDEDGEPFMALELLHGEDLQQRIKTEKTLPLPQVVRLAIQVGRALHVAHAAGLVHRDLKPANIFLARQGDEEIFKVLDFGIAKASSLGSTEYTTAGAMLGTASYMSPEQIRNAKTVDHRADLWAFAVVLFRSLTGQFPFSQTGFDLFLALMEDPIPAPLKVTSLVPSLPPPLNVFFERSFVRDLSQRYATASAAVVGFCRAAGVTVPADVLHAADGSRPSAPISAPVASPAMPQLDASDPDNAATLFYHPGINGPPAEALESHRTSSASLPRPALPGSPPPTFGGPAPGTENLRSAPASQLAPPEAWQGVAPSNRRSRAGLWVVIGLVLALAAAALFFFLRAA
jgi:serine/threonine protein kinase